MAMLTLGFDIDEAALLEDGSYSPASANPAAVEETYFVAPFQFSVGDVELLGTCGHPLPLLGFASGLYQAIQSARTGEAKKCYLAGGGCLLIERRNHTMCVSSSLTGEVVNVDAHELLEAAKSLLARVRDVLLERFPEMRSHPSWPSWFSPVDDTRERG